MNLSRNTLVIACAISVFTAAILLCSQRYHSAVGPLALLAQELLFHLKISPTVGTGMLSK